jgi:cob(I)alamin adenosyltransferase
MTRFYTQTGDDGYTSLLGEGRVPKYHPQTEAIGSLDEATAALGVARAVSRAPQTGPLLLSIQRDLYHMMAEIAASPENSSRFRMVDASRVTWLEQQTDTLSAKVQIPEEFIVPGDSLAGATMALARTVVRRAERRVAEITHHGLVENQELLRYLNRLSSLCFVLELLENQVAGVSSPTLAKDDDRL